ncbi:DNA-processing protein DprA [Litorimonas sp. RW-G-Af-16]|uniref:DNA-processing protein DprA n=1 Tax=Litorimonas sp. RW-G-Af-16 TaxID=3241168 RepID=UPI00390CC409
MQIRELSFAERRDWIRLIRTQNVGPVAFRDLLARYRTASAAIDALPSIIRRKAIKVPTPAQVEAEMAASEDMGIQMIAACEPDFPKYLRAVDPAPPLISVLGDMSVLHKPCVAIIGSRNASALGLKFAASMARDLGQAGYTVISGLARGIDASAHAACLDTGTAAVLGGGVDHIYPRQNHDLYHDIARQGALVSESPLGYRATARDFPRRNRIISGLSLGVVVIEAAERSGTLITARYALEQNREVMAAPGSPLDPRTKGCNRLIREGAALIETAEDVIRILRDLRPSIVMESDDSYAAPEFDFEAAEADISRAAEIVRNLLSTTPTPRDDIIRASGYPAAIVNAALLEMDLNGDVLVEPDGRVALNPSV